MKVPHELKCLMCMQVFKFTVRLDIKSTDQVKMDASYVRSSVLWRLIFQSIAMSTKICSACFGCVVL